MASSLQAIRHSSLTAGRLPALMPPMRVKSVHAAVEALVCETESKDSVSWVLSSHSAEGAKGSFITGGSLPVDVAAGG